MYPVKSSEASSPLQRFAVETVIEARRRRGLVAVFDFDGTLVNIARSPDAVHTAPRIGVDLEALARRADTTVGVVSGRPVDQLLRRLADAPSIWLFGLHGWEHRRPGHPPVRDWPPNALDVARHQRELLEDRLGTPEGEVIEDKGPIVAVHTRNANPVRRTYVERMVRSLRVRELELVVGRRVLELRPRGPTKGHAVQTIAATRPDAPILYVGDDSTDEDAFAVLGDDDFAVLVDDEHAHAERPLTAVTHARFVVSGTSDVSRLLHTLCVEASCPT